MGTALLETSTAVYAQLRCHEPRVLHACSFDFPPQKLPLCASCDRTREPVFAANMEFRVSGLNQQTRAEAPKCCLMKWIGYCLEWCSKVPPKAGSGKTEAESFG